MILRLGTALRKYTAVRSIRRNWFACIAARGVIAGKLGLVQLDDVLRLAASAVEGCVASYAHIRTPMRHRRPLAGPQRRTAQDSANA
jgi:hypothetical protein